MKYFSLKKYLSYFDRNHALENNVQNRNYYRKVFERIYIPFAT